MIKDKIMSPFILEKLKAYGEQVPRLLDTIPFSFEEDVNKFMERRREQKVLLLSGDAFSGKSTYCHLLYHRLWQYHAEQEFVIPLYISLSTITNPGTQLIEESLTQQGLTAQEISDFKQQARFLLMIDGYDELGQFQNLYVSNHLKRWDCQVIITCRHLFLAQEEDYQAYFTPYVHEQAQGHLLTEITSTALSVESIDNYLAKYIPQSSHLKEKNPKALEVFPFLQPFAQSPFFLRIISKELPSWEKKLRETQNYQQMQQECYQVLLQQWFEAHATKCKAFKTGKEGSPLTLLFLEYAKALAHQMTLQGLTDIKYEKPSALSEEVSPWQLFFNVDNEPIRWAFQACPWQALGKGHYAFIGNGLQNYLVSLPLDISLSQQIFHLVTDETNKLPSINKEMPIEHAKQRAVNEIEQHSLNQTLYTQDAIKIGLWADSIRRNDTQSELLKEKLFAFIEGSKGNPVLSRAAANAITILNAARVSFSGMDLSDVRTPGADLSYGIFDATQLQRADMTAVNLQGAWLHNTNFQDALLKEVYFGELPYIQLDFEEIISCCYTLDGRFLALSTICALIYIYDVKTRTLISKLNNLNSEHINLEIGDGQLKASTINLPSLQEYAHKANSIVFSPDGSQLVSASQNGMIKIWEVKSGILLKSWPAHAGAVLHVDISLDGTQLISGGEDGLIKLWGVESGILLKNFIEHGSHIINVMFIPDKTKFVSARSGGAIKLWDIATGAMLKSNTDSSVINHAVFNHNGEQLACSFDETLKILRASTLLVLKTLKGHTKPITSICFSPNDEQIISAAEDNTIRLWDINSGVTLKVLRGHNEAITSVAFSPDGQNIISSGSGRDSIIRFWNIKNTIVYTRMEKNIISTTGVTASANGQWLASGSDNGLIQIWNASDGKIIRHLNPENKLTCKVFFTSDFDRIISVSRKNIINLWDIVEGNVLSTFGVNTVLIPNDKNIVVMYENNLEIDCSGYESEMSSASLSPDGCQLVLGSFDGILRFLDIARGKVLQSLEAHTGRIRTIAFSFDGQQVASGGDDGIIKILNVSNGTIFRILEGGFGPVWSIAFSPNGRQLACGFDKLKKYGFDERNRNIRAWSIDDGKLLWDVTIGHFSMVTCIAFSPDNQQLVSCDNNRVIKLWSAINGALIDEVSVNSSIVSLCWKQPKFLIAGHLDGSTSRWCVNKIRDRYALQLIWSSSLGTLMISNSNWEAVHELSPLNKILIKQRTVDLIERQTKINGQLNFELAKKYKDGDGVIKDISKAIELLTLSANYGNTDAQCELGFCYFSGEGVSQDFIKAVELYSQSAKQGHAVGQYNLAVCYSNGHGVCKNIERAIELYILSANQGYAMAQYILANCYSIGIGVGKNLKKAAELYVLAIGNGILAAQGKLQKILLELKAPQKEIYSLENKISIEDTSLIMLLKNATQLPFKGVRDELYEVDAVVILDTKAELEKTRSLQKDLNGYGLFFQYPSGNQLKKGFVLKGINLFEDKPSKGEQIQSYLMKLLTE